MSTSKKFGSMVAMISGTIITKPVARAHDPSVPKQEEACRFKLVYQLDPNASDEKYSTATSEITCRLFGAAASEVLTHADVGDALLLDGYLHSMPTGAKSASGFPETTVELHARHVVLTGAGKKPEPRVSASEAF